MTHEELTELLGESESTEKIWRELVRLQEESALWEEQARKAEFDAIVDSALQEYGARNRRAARALLDEEALRGAEDRRCAVRSAVERLAQDADSAFLFAAQRTGESVRIGGGATDGSYGTDAQAIRAAAGLDK